MRTSQELASALAERMKNAMNIRLMWSKFLLRHRSPWPSPLFQSALLKAICPKNFPQP